MAGEVKDLIYTTEKARKWDRVNFNTWGKLKLVALPLGKRI